ncbi:hypothetical protein CKA32_005992 [Geitlerinema sp. FC II]|nr:hypothetical protein CKA32_005992 [Geitlerinema sp. FC II]
MFLQQKQIVDNTARRENPCYHPKLKPQSREVIALFCSPDRLEFQSQI